MNGDSKPNWLKILYQCGIYIIFMLLVVFFSLYAKRFLTAKNIINILQQSVPVGIATVGMVFVLLTAGIDISVGSVMYCCGVISAFILKAGYNPTLAIGAALLCGVVFGMANGFVITKWKIIPFITTLAMLGIARGIGLLIGATQTVFIGAMAKKISTARILDVPVIVLVMLAAMAGGHYVLTRTVFGRQLFAVGNDPGAATKIGIKTDRIIFSVYAVSGAMAGLAGVISAAQVGAVTVNFSQGNEFLAISAAVLGGVSFFGGKGRIIPGALMGVLLIHVIINGLTMINASHYAYQIVRSLIIFVAVLVDSVNNKGDIR